MSLYRATIELHTAFGTPLAGDTLFGQLCWAAREHMGETELVRLLEGYTQGDPWLVVSDGFPSGYLPRPTIPASVGVAFVGAASVGADLSAQNNAQQRKAEKAKRWIALAETGKPLREMQTVDDKTAFGDKPVEAPQMHNSLNRLTGTTGTGEFAPYSQSQIYFAQGQRMDLYCVLDESRMSSETLRELLQDIGSHGFGRDASIGLGKFTVENISANEFAPAKTTVAVSANSFAQDIENGSNKFESAATVPVGANLFAQEISNCSNKFEPTAYWTLAPCSPQGQGFDNEKSFWRVITRFGRHGNLHALSGKPFKNPLLLAATGAIFVPQTEFTQRQFIGQGLGGQGLGGQGLGGQGKLSRIEPATVHQGYAPVVGIRMEG